MNCWLLCICKCVLLHSVEFSLHLTKLCSTEKSQFVVRCSPTRLMNFWNDSIKDHLDEEHYKLLRSTPFFHFFKISHRMRAMNEMLHHVTCSFDTTTKCFKILGESVSFTVRDVALILGMEFFFLFDSNSLLL